VVQANIFLLAFFLCKKDEVKCQTKELTSNQDVQKEMYHDSLNFQIDRVLSGIPNSKNNNIFISHHLARSATLSISIHLILVLLYF